MTMIVYSDDDSQIENSENSENSQDSDIYQNSESSENSDDSEVIIPRRNTRRKLIDEIKENPELYATRRSERNRKETSRYNILSDKVISHPNCFDNNDSNDSLSETSSDDDSDCKYKRKPRKPKLQIKSEFEFRKRVTNVSYKEVLTSDDDDSNSDEIGEPKKKNPKVNGKENGMNNFRDNPLLNMPKNLLRTCRNDDVSIANEDYSDEINTIEEVLKIRFGRVGDTGLITTFYNQRLRREDDYVVNNEHREIQYLIKWKGWSYIHSTWESETTLSKYRNLEGIKKYCSFKDAQKLRDNWKKNHASPEDLDAAQFEEERDESLLQQKMECDRIIDSHVDELSESVDYLVKWKTLDYRCSTWESGEHIMQPLYSSAIEEYTERYRIDKIPKNKCEALTRRPKFTPIREQPDYLRHNPNLILRDYQLDGLNWIARSWSRGNSVILADEMGLGKTIQTISFLSYLFNEHSMHGPFLIVIPLSTISGWQTEFNNWAPNMNVVYYTGDALSRQIIREKEWYFPGAKKKLKFHVCVTTYELLLNDKMWLNQIHWAFLGIDEAHRLKNDESQLYQALITFDTNTRLLITGTPVHNTLKELWALLHFVMPDKFDKWEYFDERYNISSENGAVTEVVNELYKVLEPFLLRRIKKDVEKSLPSKLEQILRVQMCRKQADLYKLILTRNYEALCKENKGHKSSLLNIVMELKKCCNHTQLICPIDEDTDQYMDPESRLRYLIKSSGKMMLLDKLLFELRDQGHRVLIFSQMVRMLDIISDYISLRGWGFQRLDGSITGTLRKQAIDHFNAEGSTDFCFLLSTRAGGLGINLATADTVIIFDSDWNPQNDLQAMARAHRIGQKKQVSVYRFVIKSSIEEKIIECAKRKMVLDHLVIQRMDSALNRKTDTNKNQPFNKDELNAILKFGAADLFNPAEQLDDEQELNIHDILQRAETKDNDEENHNPSNDLLSAFKVVNITETAEDEDIVYIGHKGKPRLWSEIVPQEIRDKVKEEEHQKALKELELGPRQRKRIRGYQAGEIDEVASVSNESSEESFQDLRCKFNQKEIRDVLKVMRKFPRPLDRVHSVIAEAEIINRSEKDVHDLMKFLIEGCEDAIEQCDSEEKKNKVTFKVGKIVISAKNLLQALEYLDIIHRVMSKNKDERLKFELPFETKLANWSCMWEPEDDAKLLVGIYEHGMDNWEAIKMDVDLKLSDKILPDSVIDKPQPRHLRTRVEYLLKRLSGKGIKKVIKPETLVKKITPKPSKTKISKSKTNQKINIAKKSAEFVESSDSSKISTKRKPIKKLNKPNNIVVKLPMKNVIKEDANDAVVTTEEREFYEMRGTLFDKCTKKMKPIKDQLKYLEDKQRRMGSEIKSDDKALTNCILSVGNHIRGVIITFDNEDEKRKWRNYLWTFVNFFFDVFPKEDLHRIYKTEYKKSMSKKQSNDRRAEPLPEKKNVIATGNKGPKTLNATRPSFEARSYHEYKMKMQGGDNASDRRDNHRHNGKDSPRGIKRPSQAFQSNDEKYNQVNNSRDPRLSKPNSN